MTLKQVFEVGIHIGAVSAIAGLVFSISCYESCNYKKSKLYRNLAFSSLIVMCSSMAASNIIDIINE